MNLFSALKSVEKHVKLRCLSCEGEIITFLLENGPSRANKIVNHSRYSNVHVYNKLRYLTEIGIVQKVKHKNQVRYLYMIDEKINENLNIRGPVRGWA